MSLAFNDPCRGSGRRVELQNPSFLPPISRHVVVTPLPYSYVEFMKPVPPCVLIIEDEKDIVRLLKYNLEKEGYTTSAAYDGQAGLDLARKEKPDLIILDLMLPKLDGMQVCRTIRQESQVPIIMLTAKKEEIDRILGLELGADDYVTKPFSVRELLARIKTILRRSDPKPRMSEALKPERWKQIFPAIRSL